MFKPFKPLRSFTVSLLSISQAFLTLKTLSLCHTPSVDVFLYFFEAQNSGKKLWMSFNGVAGRVLLTLFHQSYKGFKGKFFKICCRKHDPSLLDGFPLYWVEKPGFMKPRSLEDLTLPDCEVCEFFSNSGVVFSSVELIKLEYSPKALKGYIGTFYVSASYLSLLAYCVGLAFVVFLCRHGAQC